MHINVHNLHYSDTHDRAPNLFHVYSIMKGKMLLRVSRYTDYMQIYGTATLTAYTVHGAGALSTVN